MNEISEMKKNPSEMYVANPLEVHYFKKFLKICS